VVCVISSSPCLPSTRCVNGSGFFTLSLDPRSAPSSEEGPFDPAARRRAAGLWRENPRARHCAAASSDAQRR
jgi:hypothetical protein